MAILDTLGKIEAQSTQILSTLSAGEGLISRLERLEYSIYSGSGSGVIIPSSGLAQQISSINYEAGTSGWMLSRRYGTAEFQSLTTGGITMGGPIHMAEQASPTAVTTDHYKIYAKSDGNVYIMDDTLTESLVGGGGATATYLDYGVNLVKNYPSIEQADGAQPEWWDEQDANITLTEEDATGESLTSSPNERVLKAVTTDTNRYIYQRFPTADERLLVAGCSVSVRVWVWLVTAGTVTLDLVDQSSGSIATDTTTTTGSWVELELNDKTLGSGTYTDIRISHSASGATFYVACPTFNRGPIPMPWRERKLVPREVGSTILSNANPAVQGTWYDLDCNSGGTRNNMFMVTVTVTYVNVDDTNSRISLRPKGTTMSYGTINDTVVSYTTYENLTLRCDDQQYIQYRSLADNADTEYLTIILQTNWEWE